MRLRALLFAVIALGAVGAGAYELAEAGAAHLERETRDAVSAALSAAAADWARLRTDGLIVELSGEAPDEVSHLRAVEIVRQFADARRISDLTTVSLANPVPPPAFSLEILRNESDVSLIGLVPELAGRDEIRAGLKRAGLDQDVTDMLDSVGQPVPPAWPSALDFALGILSDLPRAKVSVEPGHVSVIAVTETDTAREALETSLRAARPADVRLSLDISAPRPVISPFIVDFSLTGGEGSFAACSAESAVQVVEIGVAARQAGFEGEPDCQLGLGAPSPDWAAAVASGLAALRDMGGGRFLIRDIEAVLTGPEGIAPERLTAIGAELDAKLPAVYSLTTVGAPRMEPGESGALVHAPLFEAELTDGGKVRIGGALQNATSREAIGSYAAALFGHDQVINATVVDPGLPAGWPGRVLVGVAALAELKEGALAVTPDRVSIAGKGSDAEASARVTALLRDKVGAQAVVDVSFDPAVPIPEPVAVRPQFEICADEIDAVLDSGSIQFAAGSTEIEPESMGVIRAIANVLRTCPGAAFEVGGHTDAKGSAASNLKLSQQRAEAVAAALREVGPASVTLTARGYGPDRPVADNSTEDGRARNRRIEFALVSGPDGETLAAGGVATSTKDSPQ